MDKPNQKILLSQLAKAAKALTTLADDAEEAGYPARANNAKTLAKDIRATIKAAKEGQ